MGKSESGLESKAIDAQNTNSRHDRKRDNSREPAQQGPCRWQRSLQPLRRNKRGGLGRARRGLFGTRHRSSLCLCGPGTRGRVRVAVVAPDLEPVNDHPVVWVLGVAPVGRATGPPGGAVVAHSLFGRPKRQRADHTKLLQEKRLLTPSHKFKTSLLSLHGRPLSPHSLKVFLRTTYPSISQEIYSLVLSKQ